MNEISDKNIYIKETIFSSTEDISNAKIVIFAVDMFDKKLNQISRVIEEFSSNRDILLLPELKGDISKEDFEKKSIFYNENLSSVINEKFMQIKSWGNNSYEEANFSDKNIENYKKFVELKSKINNSTSSCFDFLQNFLFSYKLEKLKNLDTFTLFSVESKLPKNIEKLTETLKKIDAQSKIFAIVYESQVNENSNYASKNPKNLKTFLESKNSIIVRL